MLTVWSVLCKNPYKQAAICLCHTKGALLKYKLIMSHLCCLNDANPAFRAVVSCFTILLRCVNGVTSNCFWLGGRNRLLFFCFMSSNPTWLGYSVVEWIGSCLAGATTSNKNEVWRSKWELKKMKLIEVFLHSKPCSWIDKEVADAGLVSYL